MGNGTGYCSFTPTGCQNNILFVLFMQTNPLWWLESRVWMAWGPYHNDNFLSCVAQWSVISTWYAQREETLKGAETAILQLAFWQANSQIQCYKKHVPNKLASFAVPLYFGIHYSGIFSKATSGNSCGYEGNVACSIPPLPYDTLKMSFPVKK